MKKSAVAFIVTAVVVCGSSVFAQLPAPVASAGITGPGPGGPRHPHPVPAKKGLQAVTSIQGKVVRLSNNHDFTLDGFYMLTGNDSLLVKFPAHMGAQVMPVAKPGAQISVSGVAENPAGGIRTLKLVSLTSGDKTLTETSPVPPQQVTQENSVTGSGKITSLQTDGEGKVTGLFIDSKTILRLPPQATAELGTALATGSTVSYTGSQKNKMQGEVQLENYKIIRCNTITVNGQQYLVK